MGSANPASRRPWARPPARVPLLLAAVVLAVPLLLACLPATARDSSGDQIPQVQGAREASVETRTVATGLDTPWALAWAPDGRLFFTERPGRVRVIENGRLLGQPLITLSVRETAEDGALGLAVDPDFPASPYLYSMYTYQAGQEVRNRVVRLRVEGSSAVVDKILLDGIPGANIHNGGRVKVGPDGRLYATTGDARSPQLAQDPASLAGKILRLNLDGSIPADNPFPGSPVYSLGHRNPQGLDWQPDTGRLYATEHGQTGNDEVNLIEPGGNYGWPQAEGESHGQFRAPLAVYSPAIAPAGAAFYQGEAVPRWRGSLFFATLRGNHLHRLQFHPGDPGRIAEQERLYQGEYGRLRDVVLGPDGALYVATSNRDGRGSPGPTDDRILRIGSVEGRALLYPDLRSLAPDSLSLGTERIAGARHHVLRFGNAFWNAGEGPLELQEVSETETRVFQRVYDTGGTFVERLAGSFVYHEHHRHWPFEDIVSYELWTRAGYDAWLAGEKTQGQPHWRRAKTSSCIFDSRKVQDLAGHPPTAVYPERCQRSVQGISVAWADVYEADLEGQWIDLGPDPLPDGRYVLVSVVDLEGLIHESPGGRDPSRDSGRANDGVVLFSVARGRIAVDRSRQRYLVAREVPLPRPRTCLETGPRV